MDPDTLKTKLQERMQAMQGEVFSREFLFQATAIAAIYLVAFVISRLVRRAVGFTRTPPKSSDHVLKKLGFNAGKFLFPVLAILMLKFSTVLGKQFEFEPWLLNVALVIAVMIFLNQCISVLVRNRVATHLLRWIGLPLVFLHLVGVLPLLSEAMETISISVGNVSISLNGIARVIIFGSLLFWLGRASNSVGQNLIRNHKHLDLSTKEVFAKLFEVGLFVIVILLLLNVMGINLTALAVFGGAVGVGLGLGLQSIASNFISGIIILLDRSLTVGDFVELDDGASGFVREFKMRYAVLETYDGKDILVPNEKFINSLIVNWTHKDPKQRYRIDFSVAYKTDIRAMCEIIREAVAEHPQVISGDDVPFEERPDCEIDSFGDSGVNMFVEFWMMGIDDGKNRVGGDLLLLVFETLREYDIEIPFPQREVRVLNSEEVSERE